METLIDDRKIKDFLKQAIIEFALEITASV
jgi:hypothetical protein